MTECKVSASAVIYTLCCNTNCTLVPLSTVKVCVFHLIILKGITVVAIDDIRLNGYGKQRKASHATAGGIICGAGFWDVHTVKECTIHVYDLCCKT